MKSQLPKSGQTSLLRGFAITSGNSDLRALKCYLTCVRILS